MRGRLNGAVLVLGCLLVLGGGWTLTEPVEVRARADYTLGVVFLERWRGSTYLGIERVVSIEEYLTYQMRESFVSEWQGKMQRERERAQLRSEPSGLIPDIELPKLPLLGEGSKIDISGRDRISLGGSQTFVSGVTQTQNRARLFPELTMKQELAVSVNGTVGDRTKVTIDHDSERQEGQNKVKLTYTGTEDDVVRSVELGDTRLSVPGTGYTGDLPTFQGLFGASAKGKLAGVDIYAIASREESQNQSQSFRGRRRVSTDTIYARDYVPRRYYRVPVSGQVRAMSVYVDDRNPGNNQATTKGIATVFPNAPDSVPRDSFFWSYDRAPGNFDLKSYGSDYVLHEGNLLEFTSGLGVNDVVGLVVMTDTDTLGGQRWRDSLVLQLLKPERTDSLSRVWDLELRCFYSLRSTDVKLDTVRVFRNNPQAPDADYETDTLSAFYGQRFTKTLGLDPNDDGRVEYPEYESRTGVLRFPLAKPFASTSLSVRDSVIYRLDPDELTEDAGKRYYIVASYYTVTETYFLGQTDITTESEKVTVNGQLWRRGTDYTIDYKTGILTFTTPLPPDADVQVTFEYRPWFSSAQKSLVGSRAEWAFSPGGKVGSSVFYRSEGVPDDKPQLGAEPFRRMIAEADAAWSAQSDAVSAFLDRLPLLRAQSPTSVQLATEAAVSLPDPNTRGIAYLDDFESTIITRSLSNTAILWAHASVPEGRDTATFARAPLRWRTPVDKVRKDSVFGPNLGDEAGDTRDVLRLEFTPDPVNPEASWAGVMTSPPEAQLGMNFKDIENLELVVRSRRGRGNINISIGMAIDEDAPRRTRDGRIVGYNGRLDTEDRNGNGILDEGLEDAGLDTVWGTDSLWVPGADDDGNDDYNFATNHQGTEGNNRLDTEDLDRNGFSRYNHYFECTIPLGNSTRPTPLFNGWRRYRLPLRDSTFFRKIGNPKWEDIRVIRLWLDEFAGPDTIEVYSLEFTGSKWRDPRLLDIDRGFPPRVDTSTAGLPALGSAPADTGERVWVAQVSRTTDTGYVPPFDLKRDVTGRTETEASLLFGYSGLVPGRRAVVSKALATPEDYRDYSCLRIYIHDDGNSPWFFIRLGADSANYYQFRAPVVSGQLVPGRDGRWFEFSVDLDSFPVLKTRADTTASFYSVVGNPSLGDVRSTVLGIENPYGRRISGAIWFDDIRLTAPRRQPGYGFNARASLTLSDLGSVALSFSYSDPDFRRFSEGRGVKTGGFADNLVASARLNLDRFLPAAWGFVIPLSFAQTRQVTRPKFSALYPDLRLGTAQADSEVGMAQSRELALDNVRKQRSANRLFNYTVEALSYSYRHRSGSGRGLLGRDSSESEAHRLGWSITPDAKIPLGGDRELYYLPSRVSAGIATTRNSSFRRTRVTPRDTFRLDSLRTNDLSAEFSTELGPVEDLTIEYSIDADRDLAAARPDTFFRMPVGAEAGRNEEFSVSYELELADILTPSFDYDGDFELDRSKLDSSYSEYANVSNSGNLNVSAGLDIPELLQRLRRMLSPVANPQSPVGNRKSFAGDLLEPLDISFTHSRSSDYYSLYQAAPWLYRLGIADTFALDTINPPSSRQRERRNGLRAASGIRLGDLQARVSYENSAGLDFARLGTSRDVSTTWPSLDISLSRLQSLIPSVLRLQSSALAVLTDSRLNSAWVNRHIVSGQLASVTSDTLALLGRTTSLTSDFNPVLNWTATWKPRLTTSIGFKQTSTYVTTILGTTSADRSVDQTRSRGATASATWTFSAPHGIRLPLLNRLSLTSDLSLRFDLSHTQTTRDRIAFSQTGEPVATPAQRDRNTAVSLAGSYRFSRAVEAGLSTNYSYTKGLSATTTQRTSLDLWAMFRF
uniref:Gliding motility protein SprA N-terminal domain-containing protein n=1 Tax=candidate division WOR-3 bacterium TaxID=2052148 RepID=A0A7C4CA96_UNCW3